MMNRWVLMICVLMLWVVPLGGLLMRSLFTSQYTEESAPLVDEAPEAPAPSEPRLAHFDPVMESGDVEPIVEEPATAEDATAIKASITAKEFAPEESEAAGSETAAAEAVAMVQGAGVSVSDIYYGKHPARTFRKLVNHGATLVHAGQDGEVRAVYDFAGGAWVLPQDENVIGVIRNVSVDAESLGGVPPVFLVFPQEVWQKLLHGYSDARASTALALSLSADGIQVKDVVSGAVWMMAN